ncbi:hypothetical protein BGZ63DRAFT_459316 [Mariannaea sp. PMI_226]|nr:hypothetical protein BGZ63DRAFT_459316 [Mariannaea sp. PMI_226]
MVGQNTYTSDQIEFLLDNFISGTDGAQIRAEFKERFEKKLSNNQLRYVRNKYGKDPKYKNKKRNRVSKAFVSRRSSTSKPSPRIEPRKTRIESPNVKDSRPSYNLPNLSEIGSVPQPERLPRWDNSQSCQPPLQPQLQPQMQRVEAHQAQLQTLMHCQPPIMGYTQLPPLVPDLGAQPDLSKSFFSPPTDASTSFQNQLPHDQLSNIPAHQQPSHYRQTQGTFNDNSSRHFGEFGFGTLAPNMHSTPVLPASTFTPQTNLIPDLHGLPVGFSRAAVDSPQYNQQLAPRHNQNTQFQPAASDYEQLLLNQPSEQYYAAVRQSMHAPELAPTPIGHPYHSPHHTNLMVQAKTDLGDDQHTLGNMNWNHILNRNHQHQLQQAMSADLSASEEIKPPISQHHQNTAAMFPHSSSSSSSDALPVVVSNQISGSKLATELILDDVLTPNLDLHTDACRIISSSSNNTANGGQFVEIPGPPSPSNFVVDQDRAIMIALYPDLEQPKSLPAVNDAVVADETIDPKLLAEICTLPLLQRGDTTTPVEEQPKTPAD